jgi:hypothetical protein
MRKEHKSEKGGLTEKGRKYYERKEGGDLKKPIKKGDNPRRVSFAARFGGMDAKMKNDKGEPTRYALALKRWGFSSPAEARAFAKKHKKDD